MEARPVPIREALRLLSCLVLCGAALLPLGELALRLCTEPPFTLGYLRTHPTRHYELVPGFRGRTYDQPLEINSLGLRDGERRPDPAALRLVVLGDSLSFGQGVAVADTYPRRLEAALAARLSRPVQVFNLATPGYNTATERQQLRERFDEFRPHLVLVQFSLAYNVIPTTESRANRVPALRALKDFARRMYLYDYIVTRYYALRRALPQAVSLAPKERPTRLAQVSALYDDRGPGLRECRAAIEDISAFAHQRGVPVVFAVVVSEGRPAASAAEDELWPLSTRVQALLRDAGVDDVVVLDDALRAYARTPRLLRVRDDDNHFSVLAHRLAADHLAGALAPRLRAQTP